MKKLQANERLIQFMNDNKLDEGDIANKIKRNRSTIYRITAKKTIPSKKTLHLICKAYNLDMDYFLSSVPTNKKDSISLQEAHDSLKKELDSLKIQYNKLLSAYVKVTSK